MKKVSIKEVVGTWIHPNDPDVRFDLRKPRRVQLMEFGAEVRESRPARVIKDGGVMLTEDDGRTPKVFLGGNEVPLSSVRPFLRLVVARIQGVSDETGAPVVAGKTADWEEYLFDEALDVVDEGGESSPLWMALFAAVADDGFFGSRDPNAQR